MVELCKKYWNNSVVAIDLAGDECLKVENSSEHRKAYEVGLDSLGASVSDTWNVTEAADSWHSSDTDCR